MAREAAVAAADDVVSMRESLAELASEQQQQQAAALVAEQRAASAEAEATGLRARLAVTYAALFLHGDVHFKLCGCATAKLGCQEKRHG